MNNDKQNRGFWQSLKGKGYYIALILCAAAIGISGYVYYQSTQSKTPDSLAANVTTPSDTAPKTTKPAGPDGAGDELVPAIGTTPGKQPTESGETTAPTTTESTGTKPAKTMWPVEGETAAAYAMDRLAYNETTRDWRVHNGVDLTATAGGPGSKAASGITRVKPNTAGPVPKIIWSRTGFCVWNPQLHRLRRGHTHRPDMPIL